MRCSVCASFSFLLYFNSTKSERHLKIPDEHNKHLIYNNKIAIKIDGFEYISQYRCGNSERCSTHAKLKLKYNLIIQSKSTPFIQDFQFLTTIFNLFLLVKPRWGKKRFSILVCQIQNRVLIRKKYPSLVLLSLHNKINMFEIKLCV